MCSLHYHARIILWRKSAESRANPIMSRLMLMTLMACLRTQVGCCFIACEVCLYIYAHMQYVHMINAVKIYYHKNTVKICFVKLPYKLPVRLLINLHCNIPLVPVDEGRKFCERLYERTFRKGNFITHHFIH